MEKKGVIEEGVTPPEKKDHVKEASIEQTLEDHTTKRLADQVQQGEENRS